jgi:hypothetical protein
MDKQELKILKILDTIVHQEPITAVIESVVPRLERILIQDTTALLSWEPVPLAAYGDRIPSLIRSSWVFALRAEANTGAERHPNSQQRMMSYRGSGDLQIWTGGKWRSNPLASDADIQIENRWISVPPNTWHQAMVAKENWIVVSFHTVPGTELIEERPDATNSRLTQQRTYI